VIRGRGAATRISLVMIDYSKCHPSSGDFCHKLQVSAFSMFPVEKAAVIEQDRIRAFRPPKNNCLLVTEVSKKEVTSEVVVNRELHRVRREGFEMRTVFTISLVFVQHIITSVHLVNILTVILLIHLTIRKRNM